MNNARLKTAASKAWIFSLITFKSTIAHELGHMLQPLAQPYSRKIEWHDKVGLGYIMDQFYVATQDNKRES